MLSTPFEDDEDLDDMSWIAVNDQAPWTRSLRVLSDAAYRLYDQALRFSNHELTDGVVLRSDLEVVKVGIKSSRIADHIEELCLVDLWHQPGEGCSSPDCPTQRGVVVRDGWVIHDYFDLRPSREQMLERKRKYQVRAQKAGLASGLSRRVPEGTNDGTSDELTSSPQVNLEADFEANSPATKDELQIQIQKQVQGVVKPERLGEEGTSVLTDTSDSVAFHELADPVQLTYGAWVGSFPGGVGRKLTKKRRGHINAALKWSTLADCVDAVQGWRFDSWEGRLQNNDLEDCLRESNLERFRDWNRGINRPVRAAAVPAIRVVGGNGRAAARNAEVAELLNDGFTKEDPS